MNKCDGCGEEVVSDLTNKHIVFGDEVAVDVHLCPRCRNKETQEIKTSLGLLVALHDHGEELKRMRPTAR